MTLRKNRIVWIDALRILATLGIICVHVSGDALYKVSAGEFKWVFINFYNSIVCGTGQIFAMISGALFLAIKSQVPMKKIYSHYVLKLVIGCKLASSLLMVCEELIGQLYLGNKLEISYFIRIALQDNTMWYVFMMAGLYIQLPILKKVVEDRKIEEYFIVLCLVVNLIFPTIGLVFNWPWIKDLEKLFYLYLPLGFTGYFLLGHYLYRYDIKIRNKVLLLLFVLGVSMRMGVMYKEIRGGGGICTLININLVIFLGHLWYQLLYSVFLKTMLF